MNFNYKIYKLEEKGNEIFPISNCIVPIWRVQLIYKNNPISLFSIFGYVYVINNIIMLKINLDDFFVIDDIGYESIQFCVNTFGKCINFEFNQFTSRWSFKIKITNEKVLLELL